MNRRHMRLLALPLTCAMMAGCGSEGDMQGLIAQASYENMSGGGSGKAIAHIIETARRQNNTLMVNSTPIVLRSLKRVFPQSFRDLTPIAAVIADYGALVVRKDSKYQDWNQVVRDFRANPRKIRIAGGSVRGGMDHLVAAIAFQAAGENPKKVRYIPYDAGGKAVAGLLSGETQVLATGVGEVLELAKAGQVRILVIAAEKRVAEAPTVPTLKELGYNAIFVNWRGFFAAPGISDQRADKFAAILKKMYSTPEWEAVRSRNGWVNLYKPRAEFVTFLEDQERQMSALMKKLGFLK